MFEIFGQLSSRTRRCLWTAEECGASVKFHPIALLKGEHRDPAYRALNPNARVPTLRDGDLVLFESAAICRYIAERHPRAGLVFEAGSPQAALLDQWVCWTVTELEQALWSMGKHRFALPKAYRIAAMQDTAMFEFERAARVLAEHLQNRSFIVGDRFTIADVLVGHSLSWARGFKVPLGSDVLESYTDRMLARPGYQATEKYA